MSVFFTKWKEFHQEMSPLQIRPGFLYCNQYSYSWISAPSSLMAIFNICHCTGLRRFKKVVVVVQMCAAVRPALNTARSVSCPVNTSRVALCVGFC